MFLKLNNLSKMYNPENGLKELTLDIEKGSFVTLLGPSGCGKTTTLNLIAGFLKADSGSIILEGEDITHFSSEMRPVSTVFQSYALFPHLNVLENVAYGIRFQRKMSKRKALKEAYSYLETVNLEDYAKTRIQNLSGGQQQRVALARSIATNPKILLLDEPFSNLDASLRINMRNELKELQKKLGITMIFVTHDQEEALSLSDEVVVMSEGAVVQVGSPKEIYYNPSSYYVASFIGKSNKVNLNGETLIIRPEDISLIPSESGEYSINNIVFMGSHTLYYISNDKAELVADISGIPTEGLAVGTKVNADIKYSTTF